MGSKPHAARRNPYSTTQAIPNASNAVVGRSKAVKPQALRQSVEEAVGFLAIQSMGFCQGNKLTSVFGGCLFGSHSFAAVSLLAWLQLWSAIYTRACIPHTEGLLARSSTRGEALSCLGNSVKTLEGTVKNVG